ncbi:MAG: hypothetical protein OER12_06020 [Acidimicrobiia bacterium]|nr:hypothetical protein [Acidimicrobiia bacterium]
MRMQSGRMVSLGYNKFVRSDDVTAVEPLTEGRGPGRRTLVWVRGIEDPVVASRSVAAIINDLTNPTLAGE